MDVLIDIETIPDQSPFAVEEIAQGISVKVPDSMKKQDLIDDLGLTASEAKGKLVPDLKLMWLEQFGEKLKLKQANDKWLKTSLSGAHGEICCIAIDIKGEISVFYDDEESMLNQLWVKISSSMNGRRPKFIAHNAKFDLPFIFQRSVINKIKPMAGFKPHGKHGADYFCTMEAWAGFGGKISLDNLAKALGVDGKSGMSGSEVWPAYKQGRHGEIARYCSDDVKITKEVYNRLIFN